MIVLISDLHLSDGTTGESVGYGAFNIFRDALRDLVYGASWRRGGKYKPIEDVHLILLGDIIDVIRSTRWLQDNGVPSAVRPWEDSKSQPFVEKVKSITQGVLKKNEKSLATLRDLSKSITIPKAVGPSDSTSPDWKCEKENLQTVKIHTHYLVGNHDWFLHLEGEPYNRIRHMIYDALGLETPWDTPFPHDPTESAVLPQIYSEHGLFARHGDIFDPFNFDGDRNKSSLGDVIVVELVARFSMLVKDQLGDVLPKACIDGLKEIDNLRPTFVIPVWVDGLLKRTCPDTSRQMKVKQIWDGLVDDLLKLEFVQKHHTFFHLFDNVEKLEWGLKFSKGVSRANVTGLLAWIAEKFGGKDSSFYPHAAAEAAFKSRAARVVVYGHTHVYEMVPLDSLVINNSFFDQTYINSGTWRPYHQLSRLHPEQEEFTKFQLMTYLAFFKDDERGGRAFESWSGVLGARPG